MGNIGQEVARKWIGAMDAHIVAYDPYIAEDAWEGISHQRVRSLNEVSCLSDVIALHVPLTSSTRGLIGSAEVAKMKPTTILINAAHADIVDEATLLQALRSKKIWGVALDATQVERPTLEVYSTFLEFDNVIMTPHIGASTMENQSRSGTAVVETVLAVLAGKDVKGRLV